jgi:hypothetical protein
MNGLTKSNIRREVQGKQYRSYEKELKYESEKIKARLDIGR